MLTPIPSIEGPAARLLQHILHITHSPEYRLKFDYADDGISVSPVNFYQLVESYQDHPEAKSLGPDGEPCRIETRGLLQRTHILAGEHIKIGKESDPHWEQGEDVSCWNSKRFNTGVVETR